MRWNFIKLLNLDRADALGRDTDKLGPRALQPARDRFLVEELRSLSSDDAVSMIYFSTPGITN